ncbi:secreted RxLR effector protein 161-like [Apium graveolens]|uniref:secreted RxLR effector protein 161-like n=1 Tax=Apium graveolens TaxID=4045 RepID=UPI003D7A74C1
MGTSKDITNAANYLKNEFEKKDLGKTKFCLGLQTNLIVKVRSLKVKNDPFHPKKEDEDPIGPEVPYLSAIGALMYLANNTRPDIAFAVNLLARFSSDPSKRHRDGIKNILRYLHRTIDLGLFFLNNSKSQLVGYADAGYFSDPHIGRSQTGYLFTYCSTAISWKSTKQTMAATSSNHAELLAIHEASRECVWIRSIIQHIRHSCGLSNVTGGPTILFEDNSACIK